MDKYVCKCGCTHVYGIRKGNHMGIYCCECGQWLKWANKNEKNYLFMHGLVKGSK